MSDVSPTAPKLPGGKPASKLYQRLAGDGRQAMLETARSNAAITIPSLYPPLGSLPSDYLGDTNQSSNAWLVNTLASALMYAAFPPNLPFVKYSITQTAIEQSQEAGNDPELISKVNQGLMKLSNSHTVRMNTTPLRGVYTDYLKKLIVGGNACMDYTEIDFPVVYGMEQYVVLRDHKGRQKCVIIEKEVFEDELPDGIEDKEEGEQPDSKLEGKGGTAKIEAESNMDDEDAEDDFMSETCKVYRVCLTDSENRDKFYLWEETEGGTLIPDTYEEWVNKGAPLHAAWMIPVYGSNWGRAYVSEYYGDHLFIENLGSSTQDTAAAVAFALLLARYGSTTKMTDLRDAKNLDTIVGSKDDVTMLNFQKSGDLSALESIYSSVERRLGRAYMSNFSIQRNGDRVTKAEWDALLQDLNKALGGLYAVIAINVQLPVVRQFIKLHHDEEGKALPQLPDKLVKMGIRTGADSLGEDMDATNLAEYRGGMNELITPQKAATIFNDTEVARRIGNGRNIQLEGLLIDEGTQQQNQQQQAQQGMMAAAVPHIAKAGADAIAQAALQQPQAQPQGQ